MLLIYLSYLHKYRINISYQYVIYIFALLEEQFVIPQGSKILYLSQNRIREKDFAKEVGFKTCNYVRVTNNEELKEGFKKIGFPCLLKTANGGYDGKGQYQFKEMNDLPYYYKTFSSHMPQSLDDEDTLLS